MKFRVKAGYLGVVALTLLAPYFVSSPIYSRELVYTSSSISSKGAADTVYLHKLIFEEKEPIDLLIVGHSRVWNAVLAEEIQANYSEKLKKRFIVRTLAHNWCGEDLLLTLIEDLLKHRQVKDVIISLSPCGEPKFHKGLYEIWPNEFLPEFSSHVSVFAQYAIRMYETPRKLLSLIRRDKIETGRQREDINPQYGNLETRKQIASGVFQEIPVLKPGLSEIVPERNKFDLHIEKFYIEKILELLDKNKSRIFWLATVDKNRDDQIHFPEIVKSRDNIDSFLGVSAEQLFKNYSDQDLDKLFYDNNHLNLNGSRLFTEVILDIMKSEEIL